MLFINLCCFLSDCESADETTAALHHSRDKETEMTTEMEGKDEESYKGKFQRRVAYFCWNQTCFDSE